MLIYILLVSMVLFAWIWSHFVQSSANGVLITDRVGTTLTWLILIESLMGLMVILFGNLSLVNTWKVFLMLMIVMVVIIIIFWVTYQYVGIIVSHKVPKEDVKKDSYSKLLIIIIISVFILLRVSLSRDILLAIMVYLFVPISILAERFIVMYYKKREYAKYPRVTKEEVEKAQKALEEKIDKGLVFKVRENFLERKLNKKRNNTKEIMDYVKDVEESKKEEKEEEGDKS